jgi:hypothetical protein
MGDNCQPFLATSVNSFPLSKGGFREALSVALSVVHKSKDYQCQRQLFIDATVFRNELAGLVDSDAHDSNSFRAVGAVKLN